MSLILKTIGHAILILLLAVVWALVAFAATKSWSAGNAAFWITAVLCLLAFLIDEKAALKKRKKRA